MKTSEKLHKIWLGRLPEIEIQGVVKEIEKLEEKLELLDEFRQSNDEKSIKISELESKIAQFVEYGNTLKHFGACDDIEKIAATHRALVKIVKLSQEEHDKTLENIRAKTIEEFVLMLEDDGELSGKDMTYVMHRAFDFKHNPIEEDKR